MSAATFTKNSRQSSPVYGFLVFAAFLAPTAARADNTGVPLPPQTPSTGQKENPFPDFAVENRYRNPYSISVGNYLPSFANSSFNKALGGDLTVAYTFAQTTYDLRLSERYQTFEVGAAGVNSGVQLGETMVEVLFRPEFSQYIYYGPGLGLGYAHQSNNVASFTSATIPVYSLAVGYDINRRWFVEARFQGASDAIFEGYSINLGFRF